MIKLMKRTAITLTLTAAFLLGACGGDSKFPVATGKASIRAINAIQASSSVNFLIEERAIGNLNYRSASSVANYDDLDYTFNFDVFFAGDEQLTRIASQHIDVAADQEYTLLLSGTIANPAVTLWETTERVFDQGATVFQLRFAHTSNLLGAIDYYIADAGVAPADGAEVATLSFGQIADAIDVDAGPYVVTITTAGDPLDILYTSDETEFPAQANLIITPFDGTVNDLSPFTVHALGLAGGSTRLADSSYPVLLEFLHAAMDLGTSDIYDDETLLSQVLAGHAYTELSTELLVPEGENTFRYTPTDSTAAITLEGTLTAVPGSRYRFIASGESAAFTTSIQVIDRRPIDTAARILLSQASNTYGVLNIYVVDQGESIDGAIPFRQVVSSAFSSEPNSIAAGNYDIYVTAFGETEILAGPVNVNVALRDFVDIMIFDTADPATLDLRILSAP